MHLCCSLMNAHTPGLWKKTSMCNQRRLLGPSDSRRPPCACALATAQRCRPAEPEPYRLRGSTVNFAASRLQALTRLAGALTAARHPSHVAEAAGSVSRCAAPVRIARDHLRLTVVSHTGQAQSTGSVQGSARRAKQTTGGKDRWSERRQSMAQALATLHSRVVASRSAGSAIADMEQAFYEVSGARAPSFQRACMHAHPRRCV